MGYATSYTLFAHNVSDSDVAEKILESLDDHGIIGYALENDWYFENGDVHYSTCGGCTWYDHEEDMRAISEEFPDIHFELHGEGDLNADIWTQHFLGGRSQLCEAEIIIPPFDPEKLE